MMPMLVIKSKKPSSWRNTPRLMRQVRKHASNILAAEGERVLVVYRRQQANIYYEAVRPLAKERRSGGK